MAASAACSHPHVFAHTFRFSARGFLALTKTDHTEIMVLGVAFGSIAQ